MTSAETAIDHALLDHSRTLIRALQTPEGAYPASPTFSAYRGYSWFRDGSFIADGMSAAGEVDSPTRFFAWCAATVERHRDRIDAAIAGAAAGSPSPDELMLPARFTFDGGLGTDDWWDFQLDGYGTWVWALAAHAERHTVDVSPMATAVRLCVEYVLSSWSRPCFDWWEEHSDKVHLNTLGCLAAGLAAAPRLGVLDPDLAARATAGAAQIRAMILTAGVRDGHLVKWIGSTAVDASLLSLVAPLGVLDTDDPVAAATVAAVEADLERGGGIYRYLGDTFFGGGRWPLLACFAGLAHARLGDLARAREYLAWAASTATDALDVPEQVDGDLLAASYRQEWIDRWGTPATPLLWSHAMILRLESEVNQ